MPAFNIEIANTPTLPLLILSSIQAPDNWHLRSRSIRPKPCTVYLIYDPADVRLAQIFKNDLAKRNINVRYVCITVNIILVFKMNVFI